MNTTANQQATGLQVFYNENENVNIRTQVINSEPWFVAKDVAMALNITWSSHTLDSIPEDWKGVVNLTTPSSGDRGGGLQSLKVINESAVYKLAFRSNKPEADKFVNWVTGTVLPSIRRTGSYSMGESMTETRQRLPIPKYRPFFAEWKDRVKNFISERELKMVAATRRVTLKHVKRVYAGGTMSAPVAVAIQKEALRNRQEGKFYPDPMATYEQLTIEWEELE